MIDRLIGSWKLVSAVREEIPSGEKTPFLGEKPTGFLHYMPNGRMLAMITRAGRPAPAGKVAAEAAALIRSMIAYGGTYACKPAARCNRRSCRHRPRCRGHRRLVIQPMFK